MLSFADYKDRISKSVHYHIENNIPFAENIYRVHSEEFYKLFNEARSLYSEGLLTELNDWDKQLLETDIGKFEIFEGEKVPLDIPIAEEEKDVTITPTQKVESGLIDYSEYTPETTTSSIIPPKKNTYEGIKSDANMRARAVRFAKNHLGHDNIDEDEAIDEFDMMDTGNKKTLKGTGIFTDFLNNLDGTEGTKVITEKIGLTDLIKSEEQKQKDRRSTIGPKVLADQVTLGAELTAPIFPGLKLLKAYAKNRKLPVNDETKQVMEKEIDEVLSTQNLTRRDFLKATGAGGAIVIAKMLGFGDELATTTKVAEKAIKETATTGGVPPYFLNLVKKIKTMGDETMATKDKATAYRYDDYYMEEDFAGNIENPHLEQKEKHFKKEA